MPSTEKAPIALVFAVLLSGPAFAEIVPADRKTDWTPGVTVGVPGGIPDRQAIGATVDAAEYGTGLVDAAGAIGAAIDACLLGKVVFIPAGTYRMDSRVYRARASHITVRGAGMGKTVLKANSGGQVLLFGTSDWPRPTAGLAVTDGATKGNKVLTVADASSIAVGNLVRIEQDNPPYVSGPTANTKLITAMFKVVAKTDTTITVTPPLPCDFTLSPRLVPYKLPPLSSTGVEDLTIDCNALSGIGISFEQCWGCWIKNVEIARCRSRQMLLVRFVSGEIRRCYTQDCVGGGPNHEGIDFYEDGCFNLIEDNITHNGGFPGIVLGDSKGGCVGNVIAYNLSYNGNVGTSTMAGMDISVSHGPHNMMNLVEGNIAGGMGSDGYFGSTSHITMIRQGNYDYLSRAVAWDPAIADHAIPDSYFRANKPNYFGDLAWPPFDPASPPGAFNDANLCRIPAGYPYVRGADPPEASTSSPRSWQRKSGRRALKSAEDTSTR